MFHHNVAKLLSICNWARHDLKIPVVLLTTRVKRPDEDDWVKLIWVLKYLNGTFKLSLTIMADDIGFIKWYVDASYAIHNDCCGHTGGMMTLGFGAVTIFFQKQKINAKSSTEAELIRVDDVLPQILWTRYFIEIQGHHIIQNIVFQDSKSAIITEEIEKLQIQSKEITYKNSLFLYNLFYKAR